MPHVRVYRPDQEWQVTIDMVTGDAYVFHDAELFQWVFLTRGPSGGLVLISEMSNGRIDVLPYAVSVFYDHEGMLDRDMEEVGLSLRTDGRLDLLGFPKISFANVNMIRMHSWTLVRDRLGRTTAPVVGAKSAA